MSDFPTYNSVGTELLYTRKMQSLIPDMVWQGICNNYILQQTVYPSVQSDGNPEMSRVAEKSTGEG